MGPTGKDVNVIQIHPTRRCNLRCQHCYSSSGPAESAELSVDSLERFLGDAAEEGFNCVGISGGEPLVYRELPRLLSFARGIGLQTSVTTNGLLLDARRLASIAPHVSLLASSLDGTPKSHDRMRGLPGAFERLCARLSEVRAAGLPFGFIFTLTLTNLDELAWIADFTVSQGAQLLQIHPLERAGRAREYELLPPDDLELSYAFIEVARLSKLYRDRLRIQLDVADRLLIARQPWRAFADDEVDPAVLQSLPLAEIVSPLVVQEDGWVVPIQHGFSTGHAIARLGDGPFRARAATWKRERAAHFYAVCRRVWGELRDAPEHLPFTNWYAAVTTGSAASAA
ncbi:MAG: radical SAM protein [Myxococcales bacterium]